MKRILIIGKNSYVGESVKKHLEHWPRKYHIEKLDVRGEQWKKYDFSRFDVVYDVAGIAHVDTRKVDKQTKRMYYKVNSDLAEEIAKRAKKAGVKQFIYMSSAIIYGDSAPIGKKMIIKDDTEPAPTNFYGDSKLQAETKLNKLASPKFKVVLLRPPMIYGPNCKGNYQTLRKIALKLPVFPKVKNSRSMIYIENFAEFVKRVIDENRSGVYCPANREPISTYEIVEEIAKCHNKRIMIVPGFGWLLKIASHFTPLVNKAFGSMVYDKGLSDNYDYCKYSAPESIKRIEEKS